MEKVHDCSWRRFGHCGNGEFRLGLDDVSYFGTNLCCMLFVAWSQYSRLHISMSNDTFNTTALFHRAILTRQVSAQQGQLVDASTGDILATKPHTDPRPLVPMGISHSTPTQADSPLESSCALVRRGLRSFGARMGRKRKSV